MKRSLFITIFVSAQVCLVVLQIYKHSNRITLMYTRQKNEAHKNQLVLKRQELTQKLYALQDRASIKEFAERELHMQPVQLSQIKKVPGVS